MQAVKVWSASSGKRASFAVALVAVVIFALMAPRWARFVRIANDNIRFVASRNQDDPNALEVGRLKIVRQGAIVVGAGEVDVEGGLIPLSPEATGRVARVDVADAQHVELGQPLLQLSSKLAELQRAQADASLRESRLKLAQARDGEAQHQHVLKQQQESVIVAEARLSAQRRQVERFEKLHASSAVSQENFMSAKDRVAELEASLRVEREKLKQIQDLDPKKTVRLAEVGVASNEAQLETANEVLRRLTLCAPCAGTVMRVNVKAGQLIGVTGVITQPAVIFCPDKPRIVRSEIEQEFVDKVSLGMRVDVYNELFTEKLGEGTVTRLSPWVAGRRTVINETFEQLEVPTVECIVTLDGSTTMRVGQQVRVALFPAHEPSQGPVAGKGPEPHEEKPTQVR